jgi:hypothetical protein
MMGEARARKYLRYVVANGKVTRCDLAFDDVHHVVSIHDLEVALKRRALIDDGTPQGRWVKEAVTHATRVKGINAFEVGSPEATGTTLYVGSDASRQKLRVYDKGLESAGAIDAIRWELQCRKEPAHTMAADLVDQRWAEVYASRLVAFIDFRDIDSHSEVEKRTRSPWFRQLVGFARKAKVYWAKAPRRLDELTDWVERCISPSLLVVARVWGDDKPVLLPLLGRLGRMLMDVEPNKRWKPHHENMVIRFREERKLALVGVPAG